ncbi:MAG TPA: hypothetical protein VF765_23905 [Polyangiaceae bacterium]
MAVRIGIIRAGQLAARELAAHSRASLDRPLRAPAELMVAIASDAALVLGAFQRGAGKPDTAPLVRRGSGGPEVLVAPGALHVLLSMESPGALVPCDERRIVNRSVRPLLRALTRVGHLAHYFGRDRVVVAHEPVAWVGFAHDATSRRTTFEALVDVRDARLVDAVVDAYARERDAVTLDAPEASAEDVGDLRADPPWAATRDEAIGPVGAGPDAQGRFRVGGDLLVSRDALARLEAAAAVTPLAGGAAPDVGRLVDETLAAPGVALEGVRSLRTIRDVIEQALSQG